jgi:hypothetical protein
MNIYMSSIHKSNPQKFRSKSRLLPHFFLLPCLSTPKSKNPKIFPKTVYNKQKKIEIFKNNSSYIYIEGEEEYSLCQIINEITQQIQVRRIGGRRRRRRRREDVVVVTGVRSRSSSQSIQNIFQLMCGRVW